MAIIKIKRGLSSSVAALNLESGEPAYATDTKKLYVGDGASGKTMINPDVEVAPQADKLSTARAFSIIGDGTAPAVNFDGTGNTVLNLALKPSGVAAGTYTKLTVSAKGVVTSATQITAGDIPALTLAKITDAGTVASKNVGIASGQIPILDTNGKIAVSTLPAIAITDVFPVATQAAMLALTTAEQGDVAIRSDINKSFILKQVPASTIGNWLELLTPTDTVLSVNGQTGVVNLVPANIGAEPAIASSTAGNFWSGTKTWTSFGSTVLSTVLTGLSVATSAVVSATDTIVVAIGKLQSQITLKANLASPVFTGTPTSVTPASADNTTKIATTAYVKSQGYLDSNATIDGGTF